MRTLERNKTTLIRYSNRTNETIDSYGMPVTVYGETNAIRLSLMPFGNAVEADKYGVDINSSFKVVLSTAECDLFDKFTRVWVGVTPNQLKNNFNYVVAVAPLKSINSGLMVLTKVIGA